MTLSADALPYALPLVVSSSAFDSPRGMTLRLRSN
jgi:hypothetical protein